MLVPNHKTLPSRSAFRRIDGAAFGGWVSPAPIFLVVGFERYGRWRLGHFYCVLDDGQARRVGWLSGALSSSYIHSLFQPS